MTLQGERISTAAPGIALVAVGTAIAVGINLALPAVSSLLVAILLAALCANAVHLPDAVRPGLRFASTTVLRIGVALLGLQLVLGDILGLGPAMIAVVVAVVVGGILGTLGIGSLLGIPPAQRLLIACGSSICGAAAVAAVEGVIDADDEDVATAIGCVVVFGTLMILTVPPLAHLIGLTDEQAGLWAGGSIHEVAQVVAAGGMIGGGALAVAVVVKLARVILLAPVLAVISIHRRKAVGDGGRRPPIVPLFVIGFLGCVAMRSADVVPDIALAAGHQVQVIALTAAMFALGTGVKLDLVRRVGARPFALAASATVLVASIAVVGVLLAG